MLLFSAIVLVVLLNLLVPSGMAELAILAPIFMGVVAAFGVDKKSNIGRGLFVIITYGCGLFNKMILSGASSILTRGLVEKVTGARIGTQTVPRSLVGMTGSSTVTLPETYTATNTFFVDPDTGAQLNEIQDEHLALTDASGTQRLLLLNASLSFTPQSLAKVVSLDQSARREITWLATIVPLIAGVLGIAGLVGGILLARPRRDDQPDHEDAAVSAPVPDPDPAI